MNKYFKLTVVSVVFVLLFIMTCNICLAEELILSKYAANYAGKTITVCGKVASIFYAVSQKDEPTYINLDIAYPEDPFFIIIWKQYRNKFSDEFFQQLGNKSICVTGPIGISYQSKKPFIIVTDPSQISFEDTPISVHQADSHVGEYKIVKGFVSSAYFDKNQPGEPTYLNIGQAFPNEKMTVVIWGLNRENFVKPEHTYLNQFVYLRGIIEKTSSGKLTMTIVYPNQIDIFDQNAGSNTTIKRCPKIGIY